jgi:hypothetical protein
MYIDPHIVRWARSTQYGFPSIHEDSAVIFGVAIEIAFGDIQKNAFFPELQAG